MRHRVARAAVAGRSRDENAGLGGTLERLRHQASDAGLGAANREVDDVHTVGHGLVDGGHGVAGVAAVLSRAGGVDVCAAGLVGGQTCTRCDAAEREDRALHVDDAVGVAAGGGQRVAAVAIFIARRIVLTRPHIGRVDDLEGGIEDLRTHQFVVAHGRREGLACLAAAVVTAGRQGVVNDGAGSVIGHGLAVGIDLVGNRHVFWPHPGVDHRDDDVLALDVAALCVLARPAAIGQAQAQKRGRGVAGGQLKRLVGRDGDDAGRGAQLFELSRRQHGSKARDGHAVTLINARCRHGCGDAVDLDVDVAQVGLHGRRLDADALAGGGAGGDEARDPAFVGSNGRGAQLHDVGLALCTLCAGCQCRRQQGCAQRDFFNAHQNSPPDDSGWVVNDLKRM